MNTCHLLYLDADQLMAFAWHKGLLLREGVFTSSEESTGRFNEYLAQRGHRRFHLLANLSEEGYAQETIPLLWGEERQALIARKTSQHFPGPILSTNISLGRKKTPRKNETLLLSALTNPEHFQPWLRAIDSADIALSGIYSIAQLSGRLLKKLGHDVPHCLLLNLLQDSLRENHLNHGQTVFSRRVALRDMSIPAIASTFESEAGKLHQYLIGQRQIGRNDRLPVFVIAHAQAIPAIQQACRNRENLAFTFIDNRLAADQLKLKSIPENSCSDYLFLHLLASAPPRRQFADAQLRRNFRLMQISRALFGLSLASLLCGALGAANYSYQAHALNEATHRYSREERAMSRRYQEIAATFPQFQIGHETLRQLSNRHTELLRRQHHPGPSLQMLGRALDQMPTIELENFDWRIDNSSAGDVEIISLNGFIHSTDAALPRQTLATLEQFVEQLRSDSTGVVDIVQAPFAFDPQHSLSGGEQEGNDRPSAHRFVLRVTRTIAP